MAAVLVPMPMEDVLDHVSMAIAINAVIEALKAFPGLKGITAKSPTWLLRGISLALAAAAASGFEWGNYSLLGGGDIHIPPLTAMVGGILHVSMQGGLNEGIYRAMKVLNAVGTVSQSINNGSTPQSGSPAAPATFRHQ